MERIDLHTHILPRDWPDWTKRSGYAGWVSLAHDAPGCAAGCARMLQSTPGGGSKSFRDVGPNLWDVNVRLREMDNTHVHMQVLSTVPVMFSGWAAAKDAYDLHRLLNDHITEVCAAHPDRFAALSCIPMQDPQLACKELERCVKELGHRGVQIGTHVNGMNLDDTFIRPVLRHAAELGAAVFVHPWDMLGGERLKNYWMPWLVGMPTETTVAIMSILFGGVLDELPGLRICFAHGGGSFPGTIGRIRHGYACRRDLFPDQSQDPAVYLAGQDAAGCPVRPARFWVDSLTHDTSALRQLVALMHPSRVALGSDYPFPLGEDRPGELIATMPDIDAATREMLFAGSAKAFLGL